MRQDHRAKWQGQFEIRRGKFVEVINNRIMDQALDEMAKVLQGQSVDLAIKYLVVGTGTSAVTGKETQLEHEIERVRPTTATDRVGVGTLVTEFILKDNEAVGAIREMGIVVGNNATDDPNSGFLISRINCSFDKTGSEEIIIKRMDGVR